MALLAAIATDLHDHHWYDELVERTISEVEAYLALWADFADFLGEPAT